MVRFLRARRVLSAALCCAALATPAAAQAPAREFVAVEVDGRTLFRVRGLEALPAAERAADIAANIAAVADDRSFTPDSLRTERREGYTLILGGSRAVMGVSYADAEAEGIDHVVLVPIYAERIRRAIVEYRAARTPAELAASTRRAVVAIVIAGAAVALFSWLLRRAEALVSRAFDRRVRSFAAESQRALQLGRLWPVLRGALGLLRVVVVLGVTLFLLEYVLIQFPWTRGVGQRLFDSVSEPIALLAQRIVAATPNLVFLAILFFVTRYVLSFARLYFDAVQRGAIHTRGFEPEWAQPTYNLVRVLAFACALVIAYPLVPGSDSDAFKGVSILAGVVLSLGSTSAVSNIVAGYMLVYRRAFRVGDMIRVGEILGEVTEIRLQVTHLRTIKNEVITVPNSTILVTDVLNYSQPARHGRLILHTEVGIGYETPWRQVEALLLEAARRTPGVEPDPQPYVLLLKLGDFAITYQVNAYTRHAHDMRYVYADLHRNILDRFNEHGVQIMTPAYEGDPEAPKVVAREHWYEPPATNGRPG